MSQPTSQKILVYIEAHGQASGKELGDYLPQIGARAVRKQLKTLLDTGILRKIGTPPKVYYLLASKHIDEPLAYNVDKKTIGIIEKKYLYISPTGESIPGWRGFVAWCTKTKQHVLPTSRAYVATIQKFNRYRTDGLINGMEKMNHTFSEIFLDMLFYLDFYRIERFGKTKLGQMLLYAKQSQNKQLIGKLIRVIIPDITALIKKYSIDGVVFVPPTVKREVQFMKELEKQAQLPARTLSITKIKTPIIIPQKTLTKLEDRVENARQTIIIDDTGKYKNILLIDDAVGSGATMNETAGQIKKKGLCTGKIVGLAITGSFKGFDVISEI